MSTEAFSATLRPAQPLCCCQPCWPCVFLCIISRSSRITVVRTTPGLFKLGRFQKNVRPVDEPMDSQEGFVSLQPSRCGKGEREGGRVFLTCYSFCSGEFGVGSAEVYICFVYLFVSRCFHFALGKSSYNLMLKKIL